MDNSLFSKFKNLKFHTAKSLFEPDLLWACANRRCPYCYCKLYRMATRPYWYCKSKKHKNSFIIHKDKVRA